MRRWTCTLLSILILICAAQAETYFGTQKDDLYYHINMRCGGANGMIPITAEDADADGKYPCPICIQDDTEWENDASAVARGNTIVVRISDDRVNKDDLTVQLIDFVALGHQIDEAPAMLSEYLHGISYNRVLQLLRQESTETIARIPAILKKDARGGSNLMMSRRHIGNAWFFAIRPEDQIGDTWNARWRANAFTIVKSEDTFVIRLTQQTEIEECPLSVNQFYDAAAFSEQYDNCQIDVFADAGADIHANVAVITLPHADAENLENCTLCIGDRISIPINGYMQDESGIFCCVLTDAEYACLKSGEAAQVKMPSRMERAVAMNQKYRIVVDAHDKAGIMDADGTFVIEPQYAQISQAFIHQYPTPAPFPFFCCDADGGITLLDGDTLDVIYQYAALHKYLSACYMNPAVFELSDGRGTRIISMITGDTLLDIPYGADGNYINGIEFIDGWYRCMADGLPDRLVLQTNNGHYLITNTGKTVSDSYSRITPLIWENGHGTFLVEEWDSIRSDAFQIDYFDRENGLSSPEALVGWRCGLMDENGKIIAPIDYTSIKVTDDLNIILEGADGSTAVPFG